MPYDFAWNSHTVTVRFSGHLSSTEFLEGARLMGEDPRFDDLRFIVNDFLDVKSHDIDIDIDNVLESLAVSSVGGVASNPEVRVAVISADPAIARLVKAYQDVVGTEGPDVVLFERAAHASEWMTQQQSWRWRPRTGH